MFNKNLSVDKIWSNFYQQFLRKFGFHEKFAIPNLKRPLSKQYLRSPNGIDRERVRERIRERVRPMNKHWARSKRLIRLKWTTPKRPLTQGCLKEHAEHRNWVRDRLLKIGTLFDELTFSSSSSWLKAMWRMWWSMGANWNSVHFPGIFQINLRLQAKGGANEPRRQFKLFGLKESWSEFNLPGA